MSDKHYLDWPFLDERHRTLERELDAWAAEHVAGHHGADVDEACRALVRALGQGGWLRHAVAGQAHGGASDVLDTRALCIIRETLARHNGLADFAFAMQGLGSGAISLDGTAEQKQRYLSRVACGEAISAFALSEPDAGSDVAAMACEARVEGDTVVLNGEKTWISNGGIADFYVVFARSGEAPGSRGISAFIVDADTPGFEIAERIDVIAPHPLARLRFSNCRIPLAQRVGGAGRVATVPRPVSTRLSIRRSGISSRSAKLSAAPPPSRQSASGSAAIWRNMRSTAPVWACRQPERIASTVRRGCHSKRPSASGSWAVPRASACCISSTPGRIRPPRKSPVADSRSTVVAVPAVTTRQGPAWLWRAPISAAQRSAPRRSGFS